MNSLSRESKDHLIALAAGYLKSIKNNGGRFNEVAQRIGVSTTTVSHWYKYKPGQKQKPAVPTFAHLRSLKLQMCGLFQRNFMDMAQYFIWDDTDFEAPK